MLIRAFVGLGVLAWSLATCGSAAAQSQTLGSPLTAEPNISVGCETKPTIVDSTGNYAALPSGVADCTWRQSGVFGVLTDPRFSSVPGTGRITSISVRSGPNPAPIRFVVMRHFAFINDECCFFVSETAPVQPRPNAITTFQTNILVERNQRDGIQPAVDLIGISAASGTGSLPFSSTGRNNTFQFTEPGSVNAGFFYPRMGAVPNDSGGGRREEGFPGVELLMRWTWCPAAGLTNGPGGCVGGPVPGPGPGPGGPGPGAAGPALRSQAAAVARGRALIDLICNGSAVCRGRLELLSLGAVTNATTGGPTRYGTRRFELQPGGNAILQVKLKRKAKKLLKTNGTFQASVVLTPEGGAPTTGVVTLTR